MTQSSAAIENKKTLIRKKVMGYTHGYVQVPKKAACNII
jgi:hypothetical protein